jgi:hypothetical protein
MNPFIYISHQRGILTTVAVTLEQLNPQVLTFEGEEEVMLVQQADRWDVCVKGRFTPIGSIYALAAVAPTEAPAPVPSPQTPFTVTVEFEFVPDEMQHIHFHMGVLRETERQRHTNLLACVQLELKQAFKQWPNPPKFSLGAIQQPSSKNFKGE